MRKAKLRGADTDQRRLEFLDLLRPRFLVRCALAHDRGLKASAEIVGQLVKLLVAIDLDGLASRVADHVAVVTPSQMILELGFGFRVDDAVEVIG